MTRRHLAITALALAVAGCMGGSARTEAPGGTGPAATPAGQATGPLLAGEACSYLSADEVTAIVGITPELIQESAVGGDCNYFLNQADSVKVNVGLREWTDGGESTFENSKSFGEPTAVDLGDEAYTVYNESIGTLVFVHAGDTLITAQALNTGDLATQVDHATRLAEAVYNKL